MNDLLWQMFEKSGNINYYLAYKRLGTQGADADEFRKNTGNNNT